MSSALLTAPCHTAPPPGAALQPFFDVTPPAVLCLPAYHRPTHCSAGPAASTSSSASSGPWASPGRIPWCGSAPTCQQRWMRSWGASGAGQERHRMHWRARRLRTATAGSAPARQGPAAATAAAVAGSAPSKVRLGGGWGMPRAGNACLLPFVAKAVGSAETPAHLTIPVHDPSCRQATAPSASRPCPAARPSPSATPAATTCTSHAWAIGSTASGRGDRQSLALSAGRRGRTRTMVVGTRARSSTSTWVARRPPWTSCMATGRCGSGQTWGRSRATTLPGCGQHWAANDSAWPLEPAPATSLPERWMQWPWMCFFAAAVLERMFLLQGSLDGTIEWAGAGAQSQPAWAKAGVAYLSPASNFADAVW